MDPSIKKRKADENGTIASDPPSNLTPEDARKIIEPFTQEQLLEIVQNAALCHADVLDAVRSIADRDPVQRKLFIRGLGWDTTTEGLRSLFSVYGELEEAVVILDKVTGKSKGYGFITFKHIDGALLALKEPSKKIDGRMTVTQLAALGNTGATVQAQAIDAGRKIYVGNVPFDMPADRLLAHFASYGEIEEGPLGFDKQTGKSRGFALFVYKTAEAARASLVDPNKIIDGHQMPCKLASEGKKQKTMGPGVGGVQGPTGVKSEIPGDGVGLPPPSSMPGSFGPPYGAAGGPMGFGAPGGHGFSSYGAFPSGHPGAPGMAHHQPHHLNSPLQSSSLPSGLSSVGSSVQSSLGAGSGGYGAGIGGPYSGLGGGAMGGAYGHPGSAGYGELGVGGSSLYRLPPSSVGMPSGGYPGSGHYSLSSSAFPGQHHPPSASSPVPRVPPGSMYPNLPPFY